MSTDNLSIVYQKTANDGSQVVGLSGHALLAEIRMSTEADGHSGALASVVAILIGVVQRMNPDDQQSLLAELGWTAIARVDPSTAVTF